MESLHYKLQNLPKTGNKFADIQWVDIGKVLRHFSAFKLFM